jgi:amino acid adenylation domain-containing protein
VSNKKDSPTTGFEAAIIGMAGRFPGAKNISQYWENLKDGVEVISFFTTRELEESWGEPGPLAKPDFVKAKGIIEDIEYFDSAFFGYTHMESEKMAPQMRVLHECSWHALEDAGYVPASYDGLIGFYVGATNNMLWQSLIMFSGTGSSSEFFDTVHLCDKDHISTRISYKLNLNGPGFTMETQCSTSLVAVHLAYQGLLSGECDISLAGGISLTLPSKKGYIYQEGMVESHDGHCRPFDAKASGTVFGNGVGLVVLKRLNEAIADRDHIYAVIKGSAINNDGNRKVGYTAPSVEGQADVIRAALQMAEVEPESIGYIEAHGTGTALGDPIEIEAITQAYNTDKKQFCKIGSVKSNMGHLADAAGVAGLIKTVLALKYQLIPPTLHFQNPSPKIEFEKTPFNVVRKLTPWKSEKYPLRAGVSSFGIGGTNSHVVLEEAPVGTAGIAPLANEQPQYQLILLSAKTLSALDRMTLNLSEHFKKNPDISLADAAYTLKVGRQAFKHRRMLVCSTSDEAVEALENHDQGKVQTDSAIEEEKRVVFMFSGQGPQYVNMGWDLYQAEKTFRADVDHCLDILKSIFGHDVTPILYHARGPANEKKEENRTREGGRNKIDEVIYSGPIKFILDYSLARLLIRWGIKPSAMIGHSFGEYVAACLAGVFSLEDALRVVVLRGQVMGKTPPGIMMSVPLPEDELKSLLTDDISIAAVNTSSLCIVSGPTAAVETLENQLKEKGHECIRLNFPHASHSKMIEPILQEFKEYISSLQRYKPRLPYISNVTGTWITAEQATDPGYYATHMRQTVRFADGITRLLKEPNTVFIQVGPGRGLTLFVQQHPDKRPEQLVFHLLKHQREEISDNCYLFNRIGELWLSGVKVDWSAFYANETRYRIPLPLYSFDVKRYWKYVDDWLEGKGGAALGKNKKITKWFYVPTWRCTAWPTPQYHSGKKQTPSCWLVFMDECGVGKKLVKRLEQQNHDIIRVRHGMEFAKLKDHEFMINPQEEDDYDNLLGELRALGKKPSHILHLWGLTKNENESGQIELSLIEKEQDLGFYSLVNLAKSIGKQGIKDELTIGIVTSNMQELYGSGEGIPSPGKATVLGPVRVIPFEYPNINCFAVDIVIPGPGGGQGSRLTKRLLSEFAAEPSNPVIIYRGNHRLVEAFVPLELNKTNSFISRSRLRQGGVYLVIGGLGGVGLVLAEYLARTVQAKLILVGRSAFPGREDWEQWLSRHDEENSTSRMIRKIQELEKSGAQVQVLSADVADQEQIRQVVTRSEKQYGCINGVIHSAMVVDGAVIPRRSRQWNQKVFTPKVLGTIILDRIFRNKQLDFFVICSSIASFLGSIGEVGYCAANAFQDAFVLYKNHWDGDTFYVSINWDAWQEVGQAAKTARKFSEAFKTKTNAFVEHGILPTEGKEVFERIMDGDFYHVAISTRNLNVLSELQYKKTNEKSIPAEEEEEVPHKNKTLRNRPELRTGYIPPLEHNEKVLVHIWQKFFGIEPVGTHDNFFELGGDSLKAMIVSALINKKLNVKTSVTSIFSNPTIKELAQFIAGEAEKVKHSSIEPAEKRECYSLSSAQKRLYILQLMEKDSTSYNEPIIVQLEGELHNEKLEDALKKMIDRHESFKTSFRIIGGKPVQIIRDNVEFEIQYHQSLLIDQDEPTGTPQPAENPLEIIKRFVRPFDMSQAPLLRILLIDLGGEKHIMVLDMHHILKDGTSQEIFVKEFIALYAGEELPHLRIQYKDYSQWQDSESRKAEIKKQEEYWLKQFEKEIPVINLPFDFPRPTQQSFKGNSFSFVLEKEETSALKGLAREEDATLYMLLLSICNIFLLKISGQEDIVVGMPIAGRRHADLEGLMGMFVNTLALRNYPSGEETFKEFLQEVKERTIQAFENQDYQFEDLVENTEINRDVSRNPIFDVMFVFQNMYVPSGEIPNVEIPGLKIVPYGYERGTSKFDLSFYALEAEDELLLSIEYVTDLFIKDTIERFTLYFKQIVSMIIDDPNKKISEIGIVSGEEKHKLLYDFNNTNAEYPTGKTIHELFQEQVRKRTTNIAVVYEKEQFTYKALNEHTNRLAHRLRAKGVGSNHLLGIMVDRSIEMIIGILAILKAGGAYLPIDPGYPEERVKLMVKDSGLKLLLSREGIKSDIGDACKIIDLGDVNGYKGVNENLEKVNDSTDMAYVIYTSGSTGKPKGVIVEHTSVINILIALQNQYPLMESDAYLLKTSYIFDVSVTELFGWFFEGGRLAILEKGGEKNPVEILNTIENRGVTHINFVPSMFNVFVESLNPQNIRQLSPLRYIFLAGEAIMPEHLRKILQLDTKIILENIYGPTEATIYASWYSLSQWDGNPGIPIGKPVTNVRLFILGKDDAFQPIGVPGELYISGAGVARGYLNRPELTAEKFISLSHLSHMSYIYKTGDLVRWLSDGNIEFIGRIDNQVKVRGFRVELGEIENKLLKHDHIKEAVVTTGEMHVPGEVKEAGDVYLCAYFVSDRQMTVPALKEFLLMQLPDYMIPAYFVQLEKIPLTAGGKVDRKALPLPLSDGSRPKLDVTYAAPETDNEKIIANAWKDVLKIEKIGIHDNFFDIGGNSLRLIQVNNKLNEALDRDIPMMKMFEYPTINTFLNYLSMKQKEDEGLEKEIEQLDIKHDDAVNVIQQTLQAIEENENV